MNIREQLKTAPLLFDGAFGTYYAARRCDRFGKYEEANLAAPGMVRQIAFEYLQAGCNAIKTNTFGANRASLGCGRERLRDIILAACRIANAAVEGREVPPLPPLSQRCDVAVRQFELMREQKGEKIACLEMRRHYAWYLKGVPYAGYWKEQICKMQTAEDLYAVTRGIKRDLV